MNSCKQIWKPKKNKKSQTFLYLLSSPRALLTHSRSVWQNWSSGKHPLSSPRRSLPLGASLSKTAASSLFSLEPKTNKQKFGLRERSSAGNFLSSWKKVSNGLNFPWVKLWLHSPTLNHTSHHKQHGSTGVQIGAAFNLKCPQPNMLFSLQVVSNKNCLLSGCPFPGTNNLAALLIPICWLSVRAGMERRQTHMQECPEPERRV